MFCIPTFPFVWSFFVQYNLKSTLVSEIIHKIIAKIHGISEFIHKRTVQKSIFFFMYYHGINILWYLSVQP